jgi:RNA polymerase sigma-B factor
VPRRVKERSLEVREARGRLMHELGRGASPSELARLLGTSTDEVLEALEAERAYAPESLDAPIGRDGGADTRMASLGSNEEGYAILEERLTLNASLARLPAEHRRLLQLRFGQELSQSEIGRRLGVSQMQVSRLLRRALDHLSAIANHDPAGERAAA